MIRVSLNSQNCSPMAANATPAVPTSRVTLEELRRGWITSRSVSNPIAMPTAIPNRKPRKYPHPHSSTAAYVANSAVVPNSAWAKLKTPEAR